MKKRDEIVRKVHSTLNAMRFDAPTARIADARVAMYLQDAISGSLVVMEDNGIPQMVSGSVFVEGIEEIHFRFKVDG